MITKKEWLIERAYDIVSEMHRACINGQLPEQGWLDELGELIEQIEAER